MQLSTMSTHAIRNLVDLRQAANTGFSQSHEAPGHSRQLDDQNLTYTEISSPEVVPKCAAQVTNVEIYIGARACGTTLA